MSHIRAVYQRAKIWNSALGLPHATPKKSSHIHIHETLKHFRIYRLSSAVYLIENKYSSDYEISVDYEDIPLEILTIAEHNTAAAYLISRYVHRYYYTRINLVKNYGMYNIIIANTNWRYNAIRLNFDIWKNPLFIKYAEIELEKCGYDIARLTEYMAALSSNPAAVSILKKRKHLVSHDKLMSNLNASDMISEVLKSNPAYINWDLSNPCIIPALKKHGHIYYLHYRINDAIENTGAIRHLEKYMHKLTNQAIIYMYLYNSSVCY
jgi:hypothetical protein